MIKYKYVLTMLLVIGVSIIAIAQPLIREGHAHQKDNSLLITDSILIYDQNTGEYEFQKWVGRVPVSKLTEPHPNDKGLYLIKGPDATNQFDEHDGRYVRGGYDVQLAYPKADTQEVQDPVSGEYIWKIKQHILYPSAINGERIYSYADVTKHADQRRHRQPLEDYVLHKLTKRLSHLPDGSYRIKLENLVLDKNGEVVYYELDGIIKLRDKDWYGREEALPATVKIPIDDEVSTIINNAPAMKPAKINGKRVFYLADVYLNQFRIDIKNGVPTFLFRDLQPI